MSETDTQVDDVAVEDAADQGTDDTADTGDSSDSEDTGAETEKLYARKFRTPEELEAAYEEIQRFTGGRKELEEKARAYDQLVVRQAQTDHAPVKPPKLQDYVRDDNTIDVAGYDEAREKYDAVLVSQGTSAGSRVAREELDMERVEREFPYLLTDERAAKTVMALYRSGSARSIYAAAQEVEAMRTQTKDAGKKDAADNAKRELSRKVRGNTTGTGSRTTTGEITAESFAKLSREDQKVYVEKMFKNGEWGN